MTTRKNLVVVLPGIGGSVLADDRGEVVWDAGFGSIRSLLKSPGRLSLEESPRLHPVGLIGSRQLLPGWTVIHGYESLVKQLSGLPAANVMLFAYDFRLSVADSAAELDRQVRDRLLRLGAGDERRVVVVAHSLGGLVAAYWLGALGGAALCRGVITLGTPFAGAPKALQIMANGVLGGRLTEPVAVLRAWPSLAELLPRYPAVWDVAQQRGSYAHELPLAAVRGPAARAYAVHQEIDAGLRDAERLPPVDARRGWSHPTLRSARWDGTRLEVGREPPHWLGLTGWDAELGDGTVPAFCAVPVEGGRQSPGAGRVRERHSPLGSARFVARLVEAYETYSSLDPIRDDGTAAAAIGLDIDAEHPAGEPIAVRAGVLGADGPPAAVGVVVREPGGIRPVQQVRLEPAADGVFAGRIRGLPPGLYDIQVDAPSVPGSGDLRVVESVAVLEL
ncbi:lipase/acyltransferase domain-containing protein [Dactylosporangium darangshiense]|uniref:lipase/acyltransferase domain-containing protein n=1 Tax=Dactylosporangium darangshiense TaxID=579108 RepID=UPI0031EEFE92